MLTVRDFIDVVSAMETYILASRRDYKGMFEDIYGYRVDRRIEWVIYGDGSILAGYGEKFLIILDVEKNGDEYILRERYVDGSRVSGRLDESTLLNNSREYTGMYESSHRHIYSIPTFKKSKYDMDVRIYDTGNIHIDISIYGESIVGEIDSISKDPLLKQLYTLRLIDILNRLDRNRDYMNYIPVNRFYILSDEMRRESIYLSLDSIYSEPYRLHSMLKTREYNGGYGVPDYVKAESKYIYTLTDYKAHYKIELSSYIHLVSKEDVYSKYISKIDNPVIPSSMSRGIVASIYQEMDRRNVSILRK